MNTSLDSIIVKALSLITAYNIRRKGVIIGERPRFIGLMPCITKEPAATIIIGNHFSMRGIQFRTELAALGNGILEIGNHVFLNQGVTLAAASHLCIGDHTLIGDCSAIYDTNFHQIEEGSQVTTEPVIIGRNVWIARNVTILPGVTIGDHAIIGAGSVVTGPVPAKTLAAGVPAKPLKTLTCRDDWRRR